MKELEDKIKKDGEILPGEVLKVGKFLNQQIDTELLKHMAEEVERLFKGTKITKVLTIEASGIPFATAIAMKLSVPMVFAKKSITSNVSGEIYTAKVYSYTHKNTNHISVSKAYLNEGDEVLICDDFLANGKALEGLISIVEEAKAHVAGAVVEIEKVYQNGGNSLREKGYRIESLAGITRMTDEDIEFN
ncbi:xanthine phosphoribosyltransferase [bacterium]|nr:xanthine phosphoribosyltransferase [bacterium]